MREAALESAWPPTAPNDKTPQGIGRNITQNADGVLQYIKAGPWPMRGAKKGETTTDLATVDARQAKELLKEKMGWYIGRYCITP